MKYTINYHTGAGNEDFDTIEECMKNVSPAYTQQSITIDDEYGNEIMMSEWYGVPHDEDMDDDEDNKPIAYFGDFGFFAAWVEL